jgi:hypothetical protein
VLAAIGTTTSEERSFMKDKLYHSYKSVSDGSRMLSMLKGTLLQQGLNEALAVPSVLAVTSEQQKQALTLR